MPPTSAHDYSAMLRPPAVKELLAKVVAGEISPHKAAVQGRVPAAHPDRCRRPEAGGGDYAGGGAGSEAGRKAGTQRHKTEG